jgi:excisionase family DNA binding protein
MQAGMTKPLAGVSRWRRGLYGEPPEFADRKPRMAQLCKPEAQTQMAGDFTVRKAAARLGLAPRSVRDLIQRRQLDADRVSGFWLIEADSVARRAEQRGGPAVPATRAEGAGEPRFPVDAVTAMTTLDAAQRLGVSTRYVRRLAQDGRLTGWQVAGRVWLVDPDSVERHARERRPVGRPRGARDRRPRVRRGCRRPRPA